ncbi:YqiA/YcfP family alpha/beta fold hydrolase [Pelagibaculum spongiae]|uniref:Esterase YqiA n=1 Tax=Pelagibaculum spongiae TaxID=2080658 RepID=A0A2V1H188_9GAMM|nr:YqiA/YcfP family alpha/beta fold hydrolase [Pelagibaculum spongiae]PVZ70192.1 esterase YqiA [Pelagibaculum spongiae]
MQLIYIHGFNSSSRSTKAQQLAQWLQQHRPDVSYQVPDLHHEPAKAMEQLRALVDNAPADQKPLLIGSSLGGYYAAYLASRYSLKAILINPAARPYQLLQSYLGQNQNLYTDEGYCLTETHLQQLKALETEQFSQPKDLWLWLETGDEVLDWQQAADKYQHCQLDVILGGDHSYQNFQTRIPEILAFGEKGLTADE